MSILDRVLRRRDRRYVLRARKNGEWEDVATFERKVDSVEIRDQLMELQEQGYDYAVLYEKGEGGTKHVWSRKLGRRKDPIDEIGSSLEKVTRLVETVEKLRGSSDPMSSVSKTVDVLLKLSETFAKIRGESSGKPGLDDVVASILYYEQLKDTLRKRIGGEGESFTEFLSTITNLVSQLKQAQALQSLSMAPQPMPSPAQTIQAPLPVQPVQPPPAPVQPAPQPVQPVQPPGTNGPAPRILPVEGEGEGELPKELLEAKEKVEEELMPPCMKGEEESCVEG